MNNVYTPAKSGAAVTAVMADAYQKVLEIMREVGVAEDSLAHQAAGHMIQAIPIVAGEDGADPEDVSMGMALGLAGVFIQQPDPEGSFHTIGGAILRAMDMLRAAAEPPTTTVN